ncbi:MAG: ATP-binding protein [Deltaproteobacteria bacterium]|nr:ATP-binding protein [Deltaproteobacteria bacterium]MBW1792853.1 ATP-binding protein [Deltaproteobacteria bacterium]MBW2116083.1 ATP-binding protein [Deltaproteobacteria bacterium]
MLKNRYLTQYVLEDLAEKMVFVGGPRQVGKTTLAREFVATHFQGVGYYNWDKRSDRRKIMESDWPGNAELIILDEIHKFKKWKSFVKGEYDTLKGKYKFMITGSARLDVYRKGGDSMLGRYHYYRLHPFSLAEITGKMSVSSVLTEIPINSRSKRDAFLTLDKFGGFPEPFMKQNMRVLRRWHNEKIDRLFREDIRDIQQIRDIASMQLLSDILPERAGALLSINSLREDLEVSHRAVSNWLNILETFYYCFRIYPYIGKNYRSLKKEPKLYLWDWSEISDEPVRFENCVASHLLKLVHFFQDYEGHRINLHYLRNVDKKEVDFLVTVDEKPWFSVEAKMNDTNVSPHLRYFRKKLNIPFAFQVVKKSGVDRFVSGIRVVSADRFLLGLI